MFCAHITELHALNHRCRSKCVQDIGSLHTNSIEASPGSISQIRETSAELIKFAKETATPVLLIGHINKEGHIAGPKILEHMVDEIDF